MERIRQGRRQRDGPRRAGAAKRQNVMTNTAEPLASAEYLDNVTDVRLRGDIQAIRQPYRRAASPRKVLLTTTGFAPREPSQQPHYKGGRATELEDLLTAVGSDRDGEAFAVLFDHFGPRVHAQMVRQGLAPFAAADVTQDVMETIWRKAHLFDRRKSAAATWVFHIARNRRIDVRRRSREVHLPGRGFFRHPRPGRRQRQLYRCRPARRARARCARRPAARAVHTGAARFLRRALASAIAEQTQLPLGTVKSRLRLAFSRLRRFLLNAGVTEA